MRNGVPPGREATISPQELPVPCLQLHLVPVANRLPLDGRIEAAGQSLEDLAAGHAEKKRLVGGSQVAVVAGLEADDGVVDELDGPAGVLGGAVAVLGDGVLVLFGVEVLVVVAPEAHGFRVLEQIHCSH